VKTKRLSVLLSLVIAVIGLSACASKTTTSSSATSSSEKTSESVDLNSLDLPQLDPNVKDDEDLVQVNTTEGAIKIKLFPKIAPKAVENFVTHRIIEDFMIQSGDPKGDGTGGESIWGKGFAAEISNQLYHLNGALSMASSSAPNSLGSQFFIVQNHEDKSDGLAIQYYPQKIIDAYKNGGDPQLDGKYAVFGQVIEGMNVVDKIAKQEVTTSDTGEQSKPVNPVKITSIDVLQEAK